MELKDMKIKTFKEFLEDKTNPVVYCLLSSNGKDFLARESYKVELHQYNCQHDTFTIETPEDSFDAFNEYIMEHSRDLLGQPLTIKFHQYGKVIQHFSGIITRIYCKRQTGGGYGTLYISGNAPSILLDQGKACHSYENKTLKEIIALVSEGYDSSAQVDSSAGVNTTRALPYTVQYNESDYKFICRLANLYGEYFYYDGSKLIFGNKLQETIDLGENLNLIDEDFTLEMKPQDFEYINYAIDRAEVYRKDAESACCEYKNNPIQTDAKNASKKLFKKIPQKYHSATSLEQSDIDLEEVVRQERDLRELSLKVTGRSRDPHLRMNTFACLTDINARAMETYRVIKISHYHSGMNYENSFEGIPMMRTPADYNAEAFPRAEQQPAIVKDNNDPQGMGRVRVQFFWQKGEQLSPWIRMIQPYAGSGKGFYFIPEVGEEVMVDFENGNAERPFVLGAHYNGAAKSGYNPTTKAIHTQSGTKILLNDVEGSGRIEDAAGNSLVFDGRQKITLNSSIFEINTQQMLIRATDKLHITTNNYVLNVLSQLYVFTAWMKQQVSGFMQVFSNAALIKSTNALDIEAKHAKLSGKERAVLDSKKEAVVNSLGVAQLQGKQGNEYSNNGQEIAQAKTESISNVIVEFRPLSTWQGEFGFDWLRIDDGAATLETPYYLCLQNGYEKPKGNDKNTSYDSKDEAYSALEKEYECITIKSKDPQLTKYYVPWLNIFPEVVSNASTSVPKPPCEVELSILVNVEGYDKEGATPQPPDQIRLEFDKDYFTIDGKDGTEAAPVLINDKAVGAKRKITQTIKIKCIKEFNEEKAIEVYAYPPESLSKTIEEQKIERKLAGKIIVCPNSEKHRDEVKVVLVPVKTNITGTEVKGGINDNEQDTLQNTFYQSLTTCEIETSSILDLTGSDANDYKVRNINGSDVYGEFVYKKLSPTEKTTNAKIDITKSNTIFKDLTKRFFAKKENKKYRKYFLVFCFGDICHEYVLGQGGTVGFVKDIGEKSLMMFDQRDIYTLAHELLHGLGLYHTFGLDKTVYFNSNDPNTATIFDTAYPPANNDNNLKAIKDYLYWGQDNSTWEYEGTSYYNYVEYKLKLFIFEKGKTTNLMDYDGTDYSTWRWQWKIIKKNLK